MFSMFRRRKATVTVAKPKPLKADKDRRFVKRMTVFPVGQSPHIDIKLRRAYILPTQKGLYYLVTLAVMFVWSVNYALSLGYAMTFLAVMLAHLVAVLTVTNLSAMRITPLSNPRYFAGDPATFRLRIDNSKPDPSVNVLARRNGLFSEPVTIVGQSQTTLSVPLDNNTRGQKNLGYCQLSTTYPIGIFRSWTWVHFDAPLMIYPKPQGDLPLPFSPEHLGFDEGQIDLNGSEDFSGLRDYQQGDNLRHIAWKKIAANSMDKPKVKVFQDLAGQECILDYHDPDLSHLSTEERLSQLCQWVLAADKIRTKYALYLPEKRIGLGVGEAHKTRCLEALACH